MYLDPETTRGTMVPVWTWWLALLVGLAAGYVWGWRDGSDFLKD